MPSWKIRVQRIIQPSFHPYPYIFWPAWNCNVGRQSDVPGNSVYSHMRSVGRVDDTAAVHFHPGRTPIPDAISYFGSSFLPSRCIPTGGVHLQLFVALLPGSFQSVPDGGAFQISGVSGYRKGTGAVAHDKETPVIGMVVDTVTQGLHLLLAQRG